MGGRVFSGPTLPMSVARGMPRLRPASLGIQPIKPYLLADSPPPQVNRQAGVSFVTGRSRRTRNAMDTWKFIRMAKAT